MPKEQSELTSNTERIIHADSGLNLQKELEAALESGCTTLVLEGEFRASHENQFTLLRIPRRKSIKIIGKNGATFDGKGVAHILFIAEGASVEVYGVEFKNGDTSNTKAILSKSNHPKESLNIFRYVDGGAVSVGEGSMARFTHCSFSNNNAHICGGAISNMGGHVEVHNCLFEGNSCGDTGAAIDNLVAGSLLVVSGCHFKANKANAIGGGSYGAITVFPGTFAFISECDFTEETGVAIDHTDLSNVTMRGNLFNEEVVNSVVINPIHSRGVRRKILTRYALLLAKRLRHINKLERVPVRSREVAERHRDLYLALLSN